MRDVKKRVHEVLVTEGVSLLEKTDALMSAVKQGEAAISAAHDVNFEGHSYYGDDGVEIHGTLGNEWVKYAGGKPEFTLDIQVHDDETFNAHVTAGFGSENNQYSAIKKPLKQIGDVLVRLMGDFQHIVKSNHDQNYRKSLN